MKRVFFIKENFEPLGPQEKFAFGDIKSMYDNVDVNEGVNIVKRELDKKTISTRHVSCILGRRSEAVP